MSACRFESQLKIVKTSLNSFHGLFLLPLEARLLIYEHYCRGLGHFVVMASKKPVTLLNPLHWKLLKSCRQIYGEALPICYRTCMYVFWNEGLGVRCHRNWSVCLKPATAFSLHVQHISMDSIPSNVPFDRMVRLESVTIGGIVCSEPCIRQPPYDSSVSDEEGGRITFDRLRNALSNLSPPRVTTAQLNQLSKKHPKVTFRIEILYGWPRSRVAVDTTVMGQARMRYDGLTGRGEFAELIWSTWPDLGPDTELTSDMESKMFIYDVRSETFYGFQIRKNRPADVLIVSPHEKRWLTWNGALDYA